MTTPQCPPVQPLAASWLQAHAAYLAERLRARGHDEDSAKETVSVALIEEVGTFITAYTRWLADPRRICGEADVLLALAAVALAAYALAHQMGHPLDDWVSLKLRHLYAEARKDNG